MQDIATGFYFYRLPDSNGRPTRFNDPYVHVYIRKACSQIRRHRTGVAPRQPASPEINISKTTTFGRARHTFTRTHPRSERGSKGRGEGSCQQTTHVTMPPDRLCFTTLNLPRNYDLPESLEYFTLSAAPNTDLWRKPPDRETSTAPIIFTSLRRPFVIAEVTVTADWEMEWDQGGLVIFAGSSPAAPQPR